MAAQWNGLTTVGFSEIEPYACKILKRHWPDVPNFGDIGNVTGVTCDLLTAGPPCQPASCAGQQRGPADHRWLWPQTLECVERICPSYAIFENPLGFVTLNHGLEFEQVLARLEAIGYAVQPIVIPACAVDAPQQRKRVWILAHTRREHDKLGGSQCRAPESSRPCDWTARPSEHAQHVADSCCQGLEEWQEQPARQECASVERSGASLSNSHSKPLEWPSEPRREHCEWEPEPGLGRVASGIPNRAHRLRGLGNSIVPQVAAQLIRFMIEAEQAV